MNLAGTYRIAMVFRLSGSWVRFVLEHLELRSYLGWENYISISFHIEWDMIVVTVFISILNQMEIHFVQKIEKKMAPRSYPIQCEGKWKYSFFSVKRDPFLMYQFRNVIRRNPAGFAPDPPVPRIKYISLSFLNWKEYDRNIPFVFILTQTNMVHSFLNWKEYDRSKRFLFWL